MSNEIKKKVFVSGCYDMLHSGHVAFFEEAATYGDLYVGIGSDKTIHELKARKTINTEAERLYMVKSLKAVKDAWVNSGSGLLDFEKEVREFYGALNALGGTRGLYITTTVFHQGAIKLLDSLDNTVGIDGDKLFELIKKTEYGICKTKNGYVLDPAIVKK